jgi:molybdenum cofactor cytidylyltransferase
MMIDAILLAAGRSLRMGTQKLLLPFAGQTVIGHIADQVLAGGVRSAVVVVARHDQTVRAALTDRAVTFVENPDPAGDMLSSVRAGLRALPADTSAAMIVLGDQPSITSELIRSLVGACQSCGGGIVTPVYSGKRGHPMLVAARYFDELLNYHDGVGLRGLAAAHHDDVFELPVPEEGVLMDIDYPDDYKRELARFEEMHYARGRATPATNAEERSPCQT